MEIRLYDYESEILKRILEEYLEDKNRLLKNYKQKEGLIKEEEEDKKKHIEERNIVAIVVVQIANQT